MTISDPRDIPGLVAWYSADAVNGVTDGGVLAQWDDLSGNNNHATRLNNPGGNVYRSSGGPDDGPYLQGGAEFGFQMPANIIVGSAAGEMAVSLRAVLGQNGCWELGGDGSGDASFPWENGYVYDSFGSTTQRKLETAVVPLNEWIRYAARSKAGAWTAWIDGAEYFNDTASNTVAWQTAQRLGRSNSRPFLGRMGAFVLYNRELTTQERVDLDEWLEANPSGGVPNDGSSDPAGVLEGFSLRRVGAFDATLDPRAELAGFVQRRVAELSGVVPYTASLAGEVRRRVAAFVLNVPSQGTLDATTVRRVATFTASAEIPVVPAPVVEAGASVVVAQAFGLVTMQGAQPTYSVSEAAIPRARQQIVVDGRDITFLRDVVTPDVSCTTLEPLLYGPGTLDLPQIAACFERLGVGALSWLREGAPVEVHLVVDDVVVHADWYRGFIVAFDTSGRNLSVELGGEANGRAALRNRQVPIFPRINDIGHQIADSIRDLGLPFEPRLGPVTGIEVMTTGGTGHLDHIQTLVAKAWTRAGRQWTVMPDPVTGVYELHRKNDTTIHGTVFNDDARTVANLRRDIAEEPNRIYATGVTPTGQRVRFGVYPGLVQGKPPPFPGHMEIGDTGEGVRILIRKLQAIGYLKLEDAAGGYDEDVFQAVVDLQRDAGLFDDGFTGTAVPGEVNLTTWRALYDLDVTGLSAETAHIEPAAQRSKVRPWNRSGSGDVVSANPRYDPSVIVVDRNIDIGAAGLNRSQMREFSRTELNDQGGDGDSNDPNWVGTITFGTGALVKGVGTIGMIVTPDKVMDARQVRPGMNLWLPQFDGGTRVHVAAMEFPTDGPPVATVDTRFRDAMEVWEVIARNRESRRDPARSRQRAHRSSTITKDSIGEWDEIGGLLGNDVELDAGWNVFPVVAAMEGTIAQFKVHTVPASEFVTAVFGENIGPGTLQALIGNPLTKSGSKRWLNEGVRQELKQDYELLYTAGDYQQPCGYFPKTKVSEGDDDVTNAPLTGKWEDDAGFAYRSRVKHMVWVAIYAGRATTIEAGRIMWPQLEGGV